jgi:PIN domain nuclease of toxin-antitoxin system
MRYFLLDTQSLLWFLLDDIRLSIKAKNSIIDKDASIFVSPASFWEIAIKISLGKYTLPTPYKEFWDDQLRINNFSLLPISIYHTARVVDLPFITVTHLTDY